MLSEDFRNIFLGAGRNLLLIRHNSGGALSSGVANVIGVSTDTQILVDASLDAIARAAETNIDTTMDESRGISAAVDFEPPVSQFALR